MTSYKLSAYWKARKETIDACADRLGRFLTTLPACTEVFAAWYEKGASRRKAKQVEIDFKNKEALLALLERGRNRRDIGKEVIEDLGFHVGMWNGGKSVKMAGVNVTCGLYSTAPGLGGNCVVLDLPEELGDLQQAERMANVLIATAASWEPDWAGVFSLDAMNKRSFNPTVPFVDWMLYLSNKLAPNPTVPEPSSVKPVDALGSLIVVQPEPVEADNPVHLQRVKAIETALGIK